MKWALNARGVLLVTIFGTAGAAWADDSVGRGGERWTLGTDQDVVWDVKGGLPHDDHIEMSGQRVATVVHFGAGPDGGLRMRYDVVWPPLRTVPNDTFGSLGRGFDGAGPRITVDGKDAGRPTLRQARFDGVLRLSGTLAGGSLTFRRDVFPSACTPGVFDRWTIASASDAPVRVDVAALDPDTAALTAGGVDGGTYVIARSVFGPGSATLKPGESREFCIITRANRQYEVTLPPQPALEEQARVDLIRRCTDTLVLETPDPAVDRMFALSKLRAAESVFATKVGLLHSPGGGLTPGGTGRYYAAIWANDQAEYAGPFFPFLGDGAANAATLNAYRQFAKYTNPDFEPLPSSVIAEGDGTWNGAGDRGDAAMVGYGAARFALAGGDRSTAQELWPLVQWCAEYCRHKLNGAGVVASRSDELEGRFPSGTANLHTSVLAYDMLRSAAALARDLGKDAKEARAYDDRADALRRNINAYFGATVQGFDTYRYYDGNDVLRAWIASPLAAGILDRKAGTIAALTSSQLWTADGLATQSGKQDFWDRATLYALRGMFAAGEADAARRYLAAYTRRRLLGEHVPYAVEAYPEGDQSHLSAESALYCRVITEGLFGIRPIGLHAFVCRPSVPVDWPEMSLRRVKAFGRDFDVHVERTGANLRVRVTADGRSVADGPLIDGTILVRFE